MKKIICVIILLTALMAGCTGTESIRTQPRTVTQITADYRSGVIELRRQYTDPEKMRAVLNYLRSTDAYGTVSGEPEVSDSQVKIVLTYSDGTTKTYDQRADQYLRVDSGVWQNIPAEKGRELGLLLGLMESD